MDVDMTLTESRRAAEDAIRTIDPDVHVVAAMRGGPDYTELVVDDGTTLPDNRIVIGVARTSSPDQFRRRVIERYQNQRYGDR
jgi:hypothetical protein